MCIRDRITDEVMEAIKENIELAPLHNPANLMGIDACRALMPDVPMVGVFDTAFHANMPKKAFLYGIPYTAYTDYKDVYQRQLVSCANKPSKSKSVHFSRRKRD